MGARPMMCSPEVDVHQDGCMSIKDYIR